MKIWKIMLLLCCIANTSNALDIKIKGRVIQADNRQPIEYANIVLQTVDSAFVLGDVTNTKGDFTLDRVANEIIGW